ncbi:MULTISPECIES: hypothetical protein [Streptomyces]|uniref:Integral membrane protein n=1 Tax=Streptomyces desertarenae TaxID=2666184 RepID=A0ABW4PP29_9ACTN
MQETAKTMAATTLAALVVITAYTVALGGSGWLWFAWVVLGLATLGLATAKDR